MITVTITETDMMADLRAFLLHVTNGAIDVVQGQANRVAEPSGQDFIVFWPTARPALSTTVVDYHMGAADPSAQSSTLSTQVEVQVDVHGPNAADYVQAIVTLWRSEFATDYLDVVTPLYAVDPAQRPFINAEKQYETRWVVSLAMQANPIVSTEQQFADTVTVGLIEVDATYPPE